MWSDLSRLVDVSVKMTCSLLKAFFRPEVDVRGEQEPCVK